MKFFFQQECKKDFFFLYILTTGEIRYHLALSGHTLQSLKFALGTRNCQVMTDEYIYNKLPLPFSQFFPERNRGSLRNTKQI